MVQLTFCLRSSSGCCSIVCKASVAKHTGARRVHQEAGRGAQTFEGAGVASPQRHVHTIILHLFVISFLLNGNLVCKRSRRSIANCEVYLAATHFQGRIFCRTHFELQMV